MLRRVRVIVVQYLTYLVLLALVLTLIAAVRSLRSGRFVIDVEDASVWWFYAALFNAPTFLIYSMAVQALRGRLRSRRWQLTAIIASPLIAPLAVALLVAGVAKDGVRSFQDTLAAVGVIATGALFAATATALERQHPRA